MEAFLRLLGFVRFEGGWITRSKAKKIMGEMIVCNIPEAHEKLAEMGVQLQKHSERK